MRFLFILGICAALTHAQTISKQSTNIPSAALMPLIGQGVDQTSSQVVTDALIDDLMKTGAVRMMERSQMETILKEQGFQQSGACDGSECAVQIGKLLSIDRVFIGSLGKLGSSYTISVRVVNIQTGEIIGSARRQQRGEIDEMTMTLVPAVAQELVQVLNGNGRPARTPPTPAATSAPIDTARKPVAAIVPPPKPLSPPTAVTKRDQSSQEYSRMRLVLGLTAGATLPSVSLDLSDDTKITEIPGGSATLEAGLRFPLGEHLELDALIGYTVVESGIKLTASSIETGTYSTYTDESHLEATVTPQLIDIKGTLTYSATPRVALGGGAVFSIPVGGNYTVKSNYSYQSTCTGTSTYCTDSHNEESSDTSGTIKSALSESFKTSPNSFASAEIHGRFNVTDHVALSASWLLPLGSYIKKEGNSAKWSRILLGAEYAFGTPVESVSASREASAHARLASAR